MSLERYAKVLPKSGQLADVVPLRPRRHLRGTSSSMSSPAPPSRRPRKSGRRPNSSSSRPSLPIVLQIAGRTSGPSFYRLAEFNDWDNVDDLFAGMKQKAHAGRCRGMSAFSQGQGRRPSSSSTSSRSSSWPSSARGVRDGEEAAGGRSAGAAAGRAGAGQYAEGRPDAAPDDAGGALMPNYDYDCIEPARGLRGDGRGEPAADPLRPSADGVAEPCVPAMPRRCTARTRVYIPASMSSLAALLDSSQHMEADCEITRPRTHGRQEWDRSRNAPEP